MKKMLTIGLVMMLCAGAFGCTNMSKTQQGVASGAAIGALGGAGIDVFENELKEFKSRHSKSRPRCKSL